MPVVKLCSADDVAAITALASAEIKTLNSMRVDSQDCAPGTRKLLFAIDTHSFKLFVASSILVSRSIILTTYKN
jgi:hypothetical protein